MKEPSLSEALTALPEKFNRILLHYTAEFPMKFTYRLIEDGTELEDSFFLEAGTHTFAGLIPGYLDGKYAERITELRTVPLSGNGDGFRFCGLDAQCVPVPDGDTCYLENEQLRAGVRLIWGGGVNYLSDKTRTVAGLGNLINQFDTGRLIQQSYYGVYENDEYKPGEFMGHSWPYNPVQGGDRGMCHSRLIDVNRGENWVYIKSQPMNWGKVGEITPSYMENRYTLEDGVLRVDNRFTDYSGWKHPCASQEIPAFYTVSYLDTFTWYDGVDSWQNKPLTERTDLNFWGDAKYSADCTFHLRKSCTESWCAWYSRAENYGIGLFVPGADRYFAGRYQYNASKDPLNSATNYVAPCINREIVTFEPIEYSYLIAVGSPEEIRETFRNRRDFAANESLHEHYRDDRIPDDAPNYGIMKISDKGERK